MKDLGARLRERRERARLTQLEVANALGVTPQAVSKWEREESIPEVELLVALSDLFGCSTDWLLGKHTPSTSEVEASVFVSQILGFTARSETLSPRDAARWVNAVFLPTTDAVLSEGGIPVSYLGDGFLAFFAGADHEQRAVRAATSARDVLSDPLVVGVASGPVHLTSIGHPEYARPDVFGATVNRAFRLSAWTAGHTTSRIGACVPDVERLREQFDCSIHSAVSLKGIATPLDVVEVEARRQAR